MEFEWHEMDGYGRVYSISQLCYLVLNRWKEYCKNVIVRIHSFAEWYIIPLFCLSYAVWKFMELLKTLKILWELLGHDSVHAFYERIFIRNLKVFFAKSINTPWYFFTIFKYSKNISIEKASWITVATGYKLTNRNICLSKEQILFCSILK